jgi:hypothetical protein
MKSLLAILLLAAGIAGCVSDQEAQAPLDVHDDVAPMVIPAPTPQPATAWPSLAN